MASDGPKHKLVAILAADIVAYSRLMEADQAGTHSQLGVSRKEVVDSAIAEHGGRTFKTTGDGFLVEFPSPLNAVRCALAIQQDMARRNEHVPDASRIVFRIGVNLGDVIIEGDDLYGNGVNIASRLESICEPGGVCISSKVHDEVSGETGLKFTDRGPQTVKNIAKPVQAYAVGFSEGPKSVITAAARPSRITAGSAISVAILVAIVGVFAWQTTRDSVEVADRANPASGKPSIAVLAFDNLTGDPDQEYFSDGVTEDIITELARRQDLKVIARNSTFFYKGNPKDVRSVAEELGADYVVEGSLQRQGDVLRITAQLIDGKSGSHLWAETYERQVEDVFAVQKDIVSNVVSRLLGEVKAAEMEAAFRQRTDNLQAYELVKLGNYYTYQAYSFEGGTPESIEPALLGLEAYERAIEIDPDYAEAYDWLVHNSYKSWWPKPDDPNEQRLALLEKAIALDPAFAFAHSKMAFVLGSMGRSEEGLAAAQRGIELDPKMTRRAGGTSGMGCSAWAGPRRQSRRTWWQWTAIRWGRTTTSIGSHGCIISSATMRLGFKLRRRARAGTRTLITPTSGSSRICFAWEGWTRLGPRLSGR